MRITQDGIERLKRREGLRLNAYQDQAGVWTIGYGHTATAEPGMVISKTGAENILKLDLVDFENAIAKLVKTDLTAHQWDALVSFVYNVGVGAFKKSTLLKRINEGRLDLVPAEMLRWVRVAGKVNEGLRNRRMSEIDQWTTGQAADKFVASREVVPSAPVESKTVAAQAGVTGSGLAVVAEPALRVIDTLQGQQDQLSSGDTVRIIIGTIIVMAGVIGLLYAWNKAGRPLPFVSQK